MKQRRHHFEKEEVFPRHLKNELLATTKAIFEEGTYLDRAIEKKLKQNKNWKGFERKKFADILWDMVMNWRLFLLLAGIKDDEAFDKFDKLLEVQQWFDGSSKKKQPVLEEKLERYSKITKLSCSIPDWLDDYCRAELGEEWDTLAPALTKKAPRTIRANGIKTNRKELLDILEEESIKTNPNPISAQALDVLSYGGLFRTRAFKEGFFEMQDAGSQEVSVFLDVKPGMRVVDACAGAGGKTLHLAAYMQNKGRIIAMDNQGHKLEELRKRAKRASVHIVETKEIDSAKVVKRLAGTADRVLLDVPCSGLGVVRRNPDSKWRLNAEEIERVKQQQRDLLEQFESVCKSGGKMVYATCSILPGEGEQQIAWFVQQHPEWKLLEEKRLWPHIHDTDGFYMALLQKN